MIRFLGRKDKRKLEKGVYFLILPDGWCGRPYDTQWHLVTSQSDSERVVLSFDEGTSIDIRGPWHLETENYEGYDALVYSGFSRAIITPPIGRQFGP